MDHVVMADIIVITMPLNSPISAIPPQQRHINSVLVVNQNVIRPQILKEENVRGGDQQTIVKVDDLPRRTVSAAL